MASAVQPRHHSRTARVARRTAVVFAIAAGVLVAAGLYATRTIEQALESRLRTELESQLDARLAALSGWAELRAAGLEPDADLARILGEADPAPSRHTYLFDGAGRVFAEGRWREAPPSVVPVERGPHDGRGVDVGGYTSYRGVRVVGAWVWLEEHAVGLATEIDTDEAYAALDELERTFWILFLLLAAAAATVVGTYHVASNLRRRIRQTEVLGQYTLEEHIGDGGMGQVFRARHALLRRPVAIKLLRAGRVWSARAVERFEREVQLTANLTHPNTIAVFDYGRTADGVFYYVMEYLEGFNLEALIAAGGPQPAARVIYILVRVCGSLHEAHGIGLVHRDVKPANIMLCARGGEVDDVQVLDFGLVAEIDAPPSLDTERLVGSPRYMSPEAIEGRDLGPASDLYALGAVGYALLTGAPPFEGDSVLEICKQHLEERVVPPSERAGLDVPDDLEALILQCLAKNPDDRPATAAALRRALLACADAHTWDNDRAATWWSEHKALIATLRDQRTTAAEPDHTLTVDLGERLE